MYNYDSFNNGFIHLMKRFQSFSHEIGNGTKEIIGTQFNLTDPTLCYINHPYRKLNIEYPINEFAWYLTGDKHIYEIGKHASRWNEIADKNFEVESNYGYYIWQLPFHFYKEYVIQWDWCIEELVNDNNSRRAVLNILYGEHKICNKNDMPCTSTIQFLVRNEKLYCIVNMRSCDVIYGLCNDIFCFSMIQQCMLNELNKKGFNLSLGYLQMNFGSLHVYKKHYRFIDYNWDIDNPEKLKKIKLKDDFICSELMRDKENGWPMKNFEFSSNTLRNNLIITDVEQEYEY